MRSGWFVAVVLPACVATTRVSTPPPAPDPTPPAASSSPAASTGEPAAPPVTSTTAPPGQPLFGRLDEDALPPVPCDLSRVYRGRLGASRVTLRLSRAGDTVKGLAYRDQDGPAVEVTGRVQDGVVTLAEKTGGTFRGACVAGTGSLKGTHESRGKQQPFFLLARPAGEVAIHASIEETRSRTRVAPECRKIPPASYLRFLRRDPRDPDSDVMCPGTGPDASTEHEGTDTSDCVWLMAAPRVFGLDDAAVEKAVNGLLGHDGQPHSAASVRAKTKRCELGQHASASGTFRVTLNTKEVLSVLLLGEFATVAELERQHVGPRGITVDVQSGRRLALQDVVTSEKAFAEAAESCLPAWRKIRGKVARSRFFEDHGGDREVLGWVVVPGGIAVVGVEYEDARATLAGQGPIVSFAGLRSRQLLRADSPVARLWADERPASPEAALCTSALGVDEIVALP